MKKTLIALSVATLGFAATAQAAVEASAVATWQATAKKDTTSELVVTPLSSLSFQYAEGIKGFNTVNGLFDVAIKGDASATDFTLKAKKLNGTLNHLGGDSTVDVGVLWGGAPVSTTAYTTLIDTAAGITGGICLLLPTASRTMPNASRRRVPSLSTLKAPLPAAPPPPLTPCRTACGAVKSTSSS